MNAREVLQGRPYPKMRFLHDHPKGHSTAVFVSATPQRSLAGEN